MTIGVLIDNGGYHTVSALAATRAEGLTQALVMTWRRYLVHLWLLDRVQQVGSVPAHYRVPELDQMMIMAGVIGFILGFCVPTWCRKFILGSCMPTWCREAPRSSPEPIEANGQIYLPASGATKPITSG